MTHAENNSIVPTAPKGKEIIKWLVPGFGP